MEPLSMLINGPNVIHTCSPKPMALRAPGPLLPDQVGLVCDEVCFYHTAGNHQVVFMEQEADHSCIPALGYILHSSTIAPQIVLGVWPCWQVWNRPNCSRTSMNFVHPIPYWLVSKCFCNAVIICLSF
ncbi:hypothetical protein BS17DRAFT_790730, partial [Gyrodon lividus]